MIPIGHELRTTNYKSDGYMELLIHIMMVFSSPSTTNIYLEPLGKGGRGRQNMTRQL